MQFKDYYQALGVARGASAEDIKKAFRRLARKYHPDVSKEKDAEEKFKDVQVAYDTLSDPEKRAAYDQLGQHRPGEDFRPPPGWERHFRFEQGSFEDLDLADLFEHFGGGVFQARGARTRRAGSGEGGFALPGQDYEVTAQLSLETGVPVVPVGINFPGYRPGGGQKLPPMEVRIGPPLAPGKSEGPSSARRAYEWHVTIMNEIGRLSGKAWGSR